MKNKKINDKYGKIDLEVYNYTNNRIAIILYVDGEEWDDLTINLPEYFLRSKDEGFINGDVNSTDPENINYVTPLKELGIIKKSYGFVKYNLGKYEHVKFDLEKLKEYDPIGVEKYYKVINGLNDIDNNEVNMKI